MTPTQSNSLFVYAQIFAVIVVSIALNPRSRAQQAAISINVSGGGPAAGEFGHGAKGGTVDLAFATSVDTGDGSMGDVYSARTLTNGVYYFHQVLDTNNTTVLTIDGTDVEIHCQYVFAPTRIVAVFTPDRAPPNIRIYAGPAVQTNLFPGCPFPGTVFCNTSPWPHVVRADLRPLLAQPDPDGNKYVNNSDGTAIRGATFYFATVQAGTISGGIICDGGDGVLGGDGGDGGVGRVRTGGPLGQFSFEGNGGHGGEFSVPPSASTNGGKGGDAGTLTLIAGSASVASLTALGGDGGTGARGTMQHPEGYSGGDGGKGGVLTLQLGSSSPGQIIAVDGGRGGDGGSGMTGVAGGDGSTGGAGGAGGDSGIVEGAGAPPPPFTSSFNAGNGGNGGGGGNGGNNSTGAGGNGGDGGDGGDGGRGLMTGASAGLGGSGGTAGLGGSGSPSGSPGTPGEGGRCGAPECLDQRIDFGSVYIGRTAARTWSFRNTSATASASYTLTTPVQPFGFHFGALSGTVPPLGSSSVIFEFMAPTTLPDVDADFFQDLQLTITPDISDPGTVYTSMLTFSATAYGPYPINAQKTVTPKQNTPFTLKTTVAWRSSTDVIDDLDDIQVREVLSFVGYKTEPGFKILPDYPSCGVNTPASNVSSPPPWVIGPGRPGAGTPVVRTEPDLNLLASSLPGSVNGRPNKQYDSPYDLLGGPGPGVQYFYDGHYVGDFKTHLVSGSYTLNQKYQWTAPYLKDSSGCTVWLPMYTHSGNTLGDSVSRTVAIIGGRWTGKVISAATGGEGDFDLGAVSASGTALGTPTPTIKITWLVTGSLLQCAPSLDGPWTDIMGSISVNEMSFPIIGAISQFFQITLPVP